MKKRSAFITGIVAGAAYFYAGQDYAMNVVRRHYSTMLEQWIEEYGRLSHAAGDHIASFKFLFGRPVARGFNVASTDRDYRYTLVVGRTRRHMWFLSRDKTMPGAVFADFLTSPCQWVSTSGNSS